MLFTLPDPKTLYAAIVARSDEYECRAYVCVSSTGIFCRLNCPARNPKPENCGFYETVAECISAGFRPCKRCHPLSSRTESDPIITSLVGALNADTSRRWGEDNVAAMGYDPSTVRRAFKRQFGITFLEMARLSRIRDGFEVLADGGRVIDAQLTAGFSSDSAFRSAFAKLMGVPPSAFLGEDALLRADWLDTPLGAMIIVADKRSVHLLEFADRKGLPRELGKLMTYAKCSIGIGRFEPTDQMASELSDFFAGKSAEFKTRLTMHGSEFTRSVWTALCDIPAGATISYGQLAKNINHPTASRAVARANGANQIAIVIPCHRVIGADGTLTGYGGGLWRKQKLIELENSYAIK
ncbi:ada regulatory protein / o-6-methylguanine-dna-alkyltransferase [Rhodobacterales bacterium HTCC2150]|nr:ada regulatory protein / o-6-methylguanine-dna-alkyltransferase [Rhodobacterales bacterium HTCC2150] [Rhodobacteraceae bacterium HTCC2150]